MNLLFSSCRYDKDIPSSVDAAVIQMRAEHCQCLITAISLDTCSSHSFVNINMKSITNFIEVDWYEINPLFSLYPSFEKIYFERKINLPFCLRSK